MNSKIVGKLTVDPHDKQLFCSAPFPIPYFDNQEVPVHFLDADDPQTLAAAEQVLENFLRKNTADRTNDSYLVNEYYQAAVNYGLFKPTGEAVDLWSMVHPIEITIHPDIQGRPVVEVSCGCDWEEEHGLQLEFRNGKVLTQAGGHELNSRYA